MSTNPPKNNNNEKTIFKCDQHAGIIFEKLLSFYEGNELFDTALITGVETNRISIQAHRIVLSALSEYFLEIFRDAQTALKKNVLEFKEIETATLKLIIDFMYTGSIELDLETVEGILRAASFLKMNILVNGCCEFIEENINYSNSLAWFRLATDLSLYRLKVKSLECTYTHFEQISKENELLMLSVNELKDLLFNDNPHGDFEEHVFLSVVKWINYDKLDREHLAIELLSMVRFQHLTAKFIIENRKSVCYLRESHELIYNWLQWHLSPETRPLDQKIDALKPRKVPDKKLAVVDISDSDSNKIVIQIYNNKKDLWSVEKQTPLSEDKKLISTIVINDRLIVVGGKDCNNLTTNSVECLDLHTFKWTKLPSMENNRVSCQLADLKGYLCVFGGYDRGSFVDSIEIYNTSTQKWHDVQPLSQPTHASKIAAHNGILYILDFHSGCLQSYDVSSNKWTLKAIEKDLLCNFGFAAVEGGLYVIDGRRGERLQETVKHYNILKDLWFEVAPLSRSMSYIKITALENKIVICGKTINYIDVVAEYDLDIDIWNNLGTLSMDSSIHSIVICTLTAKIK